MVDLETFSSCVMLFFAVLGMIAASLFIITVIKHPQCHTATILLVFNTAIAGFFSNTVAASQAIYQLLGDQEDSLCQLRGYLMCSASALIYHTLGVQALHRLFVIVFSTQRSLQSKTTLWTIVMFQWTLSLCFPLPIMLTGRIRFNPGSRICTVSDALFERPTNERTLLIIGSSQ